MMPQVICVLAHSPIIEKFAKLENARSFSVTTDSFCSELAINLLLAVNLLLSFCKVNCWKL